MPLTIDHPDADRLARKLAAETGESITEAVMRALDERLRRERGEAGENDLAEVIMAIGRRCAALPTLDDRSAEEIIGYDEQGLTDHQAGAARLRHERAGTGEDIEAEAAGTTGGVNAQDGSGDVAGERLSQRLRAIRKRCAAFPVFDTRSSDEILGYDENGLPTRW